MKVKHSLFFTLMILGVFGCASAPKEVPTDHLDQGPNIVRYIGKITNIREVKKDASLGRQFEGSFVGALIGGQIGGGSTQIILGTSGAFIGADVMNDKYGEIIDRVILTSDEGEEFQCLVHGHDFKVGDKVIFTLVEDHISAIIHSE
jgi:outer membrane lipoprotein SlyB